MNSNLSKISWRPVKDLACFNIEDAQVHFDDLAKRLSDGGFVETTRLLRQCLDLQDFLRAVISYSPYLRDCMSSDPGLLDEILSCGFERICKESLQTTAGLGLANTNETDLARNLRKMKIRVALACGLADLGGWQSGEKTTKILSQFADACLRATFDFIFRDAALKGNFVLEDVDEPQKDCGLIVLAMGKHGAFELNYSSDIDLVLFHDKQAEKRIRKMDTGVFFSKMAKRLVKLLQERTKDGYVFRVDLRLRPDPSSTPPIMPLVAALIYYESLGQNWERAALIKARPVAGDMEAGRRALTKLTPFIWRKYLDYAAIQDIHSIKRQIHAHKGHATIATMGHNVKLGRGGIREIEFFAQTQQLIAGGRVPQLREQRTVKAINALFEHSWIDEDTARELTCAYWFLRDVEHRLQMMRDEQTHTLPADENEFRRVSLMMGYQDSATFSDELILALQRVEKHYSNLFEKAPELTAATGNLVFTGDDEDTSTIKTLSAMGYKQPSDVIRIVRGWHFGRYPALRASQSRELLTELTPILLKEFARGGRGNETIIAMDRFIAGLPAGIQLFALLNSNPALLSLLALLLGGAPRLAETITRRPHVFDGLIDPSTGTALPEIVFLFQRLQQSLSRASDYESKLDQARIFAAEQKFLIGVRLVNSTINAFQAARAFSNLAEAMIQAMINVVKVEFENKYGIMDGGAICLLAMGSLGSGELSASSDLDLVFLYDHSGQVEYSDGPKRLAPSQYFIRFAQRLAAAMSAPTAEGVIYKLDFRLRPSGNSGPLATSIGSFLKYQQEHAWTWEKQALTRARPIAGNEALCALIDKEIGNLIASSANTSNLKSDIREMRHRIEQEKGSLNPWDCKNVVGGLIDIEFIAQWLVLENGRLPLASARNPRAIIQSRRGKTISHEDCDCLLGAFDLYSTILQILHSCLNYEFDPALAFQGLEDILCRATGLPDISIIAAQLKKNQHNVRKIFIHLMS